MANCSYFLKLSGILKLLSVILGGLSLYGGLRGFINSEINKFCRDGDFNATLPEEIKPENNRTLQTHCDILWMERSSLQGISVTTLLSLVFLIAFLLSETLSKSKISNAIDFYFHFTGAIVLIVSGIFIGFSAMEIDDNICKGDYTENCQLFMEKIACSGIAVLNGIIFASIVLSVNNIQFYIKYEEV